MQKCAQLEKYLQLCDEFKASDLHLKVGIRPTARTSGKLRIIDNRVLDAATMETFVRAILSSKQIEDLNRRVEIDTSFAISDTQRYRCNVYRDMYGLAISIRRFMVNVGDFRTLGIPEVLKQLVLRKNGLILVTGPTGSGKSTTLAGLINYLNENVSSHIITLEDPIEYIHISKKCMITQREIGRDSLSFASGLRSALRQDPDVIMLGEMRDPESISTALTAAETGHLVLGTIHTMGAENTVDRIIDSFPADQQDQVRVQLSMVLLGVLSQQLLPKAYGDERALATELMVSSGAIRSIIRQGKSQQLSNTMMTSRAQGMYTLNQCLEQLLQSGEITQETYQLYMTNPDKK